MAAIKCAITSDNHFNIPKRSDEAKRILNWMLEDWKARGVHLIGFAGDLADGPMTERDRAWLIDYVVKCADVAPVILCDGNHENELSLRNALSGRSGKYRIIVEDGANVQVVETSAGPIAVPCVSFPKKAALLAAVGRPVSGEEAEAIAGQALQDVFRGLGVKIRELGLPTLALVHGTISGSKIAEDQPDRPMGLNMPAADLAEMEADLTVIGHVHMQQHFSFNGRDFVVPGSPFFADYGEAKYQKGYVLAEFHPPLKGLAVLINDDKTSTIDMSKVGKTAIWQRIPTPATPMLLAEYEWSPDGMFLRDGEQLHESDLDPEGADIRLRFRFASDQRKAAVEAANGIAGLWRVSGAVNVKLDPVLIPTSRSRIPALATTPLLEDKVRLYWKAIGFEPSPEREVALMDCLHELRDAAAAKGLAMGTTGRAAPTLKKIRGRGFMKFPEEFSVDFTELEGPLTAIIAPNESGKSVLVQLMGPGVLYGKTADRGALDELAVTRESFIEAEFSMAGAEYKITQVASTKSASGRISKAGTVSVLKNGVAELGNKSAGGRDDYTKWAAKNIIPQTVYDAVICQSGTDSIIELKEGPRVELLLRILGLEMYEALAKMSRDLAAETNSRLTGIRERVEELGEVDIAAAQLALTTLQEQKVNLYDLPLFNAAEALAQARLRANKIDTLRAEHDSLITKRDELAVQVATMRERRRQVQTRIDVCGELTSQKTNIEEAVATLANLQNELTALPTTALQAELSREQLTIVNLDLQAISIDKRIEELVAQDEQLSARLTGIQSQMDEMRALNADAGTIRKAVADSESHRSSLATKQAEVSQRKINEAELAGELRDVRARFNGNAQKGAELHRRISNCELLIGPAGRLKTEALNALDSAQRISADISTAETKESQYVAEIEALQRTSDTVWQTRVGGLRGGLTEISCGLAEPVAAAMGTLSKDDNIEAEAEDNPLRLGSTHKARLELSSQLREMRNALTAQEKIAAQLPGIEAAEKDLTSYAEEALLVGALRLSLIDESNQIIAKQDLLAVEMEQTQSDVRWLNDQIKGLESLVARAELLATAETKLHALGEQAATVVEDRNAVQTSLIRTREERVKLQMVIEDADLRCERVQIRLGVVDEQSGKLLIKIEELRILAGQSELLIKALASEEHLLHQISGIDAELEPLEHACDGAERRAEAPAPEPVDISAYEQSVKTARESLNEMQSRIALADRDLRDAEAKDERRQKLTGQIRGLEEQAANWTLLGQHLGKTCLQAEEISCAGPQLTELTNDLLRTVGDTRHTVSIETERLHSNKKDLIPCLDIMVEDSEEGVTKESRRLSSAGKILVGEPFSLATVLLACQRAGIKAPTIFRDEATGVMDAVNAPRYIGMLRRFAELLDARVVFVSQQSAIQDLADSRVHVENGILRVA